MGQNRNLDHQTSQKLGDVFVTQNGRYITDTKTSRRDLDGLRFGHSLIVVAQLRCNETIYFRANHVPDEMQASVRCNARLENAGGARSRT